MSKQITDLQLITGLQKQLKIIPQNEFKNIKDAKKIPLALIILPKINKKSTVQNQDDQKNQISPKQLLQTLPHNPSSQQFKKVLKQINADNEISFQILMIQRHKKVQFEAQNYGFVQTQIDYQEKDIVDFTYVPLNQIRMLTEKDVIFHKNDQFFQTKQVLPTHLQDIGQKYYKSFTSAGLILSEQVKIWGITMIALTYIFSMFQVTIYKKLYYKNTALRKSQQQMEVQSTYNKVLKKLKSQNNSLEFQESMNKYTLELVE
ncbi:hypothetical protein PPERSA_02300 [Pseudocohnilembus persalinus]|uniref:Transmembrane protein n=1 Tax=Pseudocohnilembus persalinus TaxID=266149 RepID=A0A0V0QHW4_PSEPJ|nr:hypothetical protein PPERSA_02300 [Pseudocohnilembus persalinus]|eukprot:KRX01772.1 hypothetical protein PPERSA_02300 [Pseudocohnilembus persalinus]